MIEIKFGESGIYDFGLEISGDANGQPTLRMVIVHPCGYLLSFPAIQFEGGGGYRVSLPCLDSMLPSGEHHFSLEVILGDRIFYPLTDTIKIVEPPRVNATLATTVGSAQPTVSATFAQPIAASPTVVAMPQYTPESKVEVKTPIVEEKKKPAQADVDLMAALLKKRK